MIYRIADISNATIIVSPSYQYEKLLELSSLNKFCKELNSLLQNEEQFQFYIFWGFIEEETILLNETANYSKEKNNVLFWIGDEEGYMPSDTVFSRFNYIFKVHLKNKDAIDIKNGINIFRPGLYHFPLLTIDDVPELPILPFCERKYSVYFCGNLNKNRVPFYVALNKKVSLLARLDNFLLKYNLRGGDRLYELCFKNKSFDISYLYDNACIKFYSGFNNGDNYNKYAHFLQNSKIVLSPKGFHSTECFRLYEAMRQGCIVVTEPLPHVWCYKDAPCITIDSWKNLSSNLLNNAQVFNKWSPNMIRKYYDERLSVKGIANYVGSILNNTIQF